MIGAQASASTMVDVLIPIWQRVLQRPSVGAEDNFFDLGGDSARAIELFGEIAQLNGRSLPPVMILQAPTITSLAALLANPASSQLPPVVSMKAGTEGAPAFIVAGLGGSLLELIQLARQIQSPHPILGLVARGVDGVDEPFDRVEDMAGYYLDVVKKLQPHGPYFLIGGSFGGLVMLEMAQRLTESGEKIGLLAMLDSYPHFRYLSLPQRARLIARRSKHHFSTLTQLPGRESLSYVVRLVKARMPASGDHRKRMSERLAIATPLSPAMVRVRDSDYLALAGYRPRFYPGRIKFVRAESGSHFPEDAAAVWDNLADDVEVETVPGDHREMITTHFESLASVISRYLEEASS
jgi:acetoacetyl-CoA synthetase